MPLVGFPRAAVAVKRLQFNAGPTRGTHQLPDTRRVGDNAVQRGACQLAAFAKFGARTCGFRQRWLVEKSKSVKPADKPDFVRLTTLR